MRHFSVIFTDPLQPLHFHEFFYAKFDACALFAAFNRPSLDEVVRVLEDCK